MMDVGDIFHFFLSSDQWGVQPQWSIDKIRRQLLYETDYAWSGSTRQDAKETEAEVPNESLQAQHSPTLSTHSSVVDLAAQDAGLDSDSDSEFEEVFESHELPPASFEEGNKSLPGQPLSLIGAHKKKLIEGGKKAAVSAAKKGKKAAASASEKVQQALLGASNMDAGSSNEYGDLDWQQAGHNADAQDLAGPGAQGHLECTVDKPQKEGEGTQNPYISYVVTTNTDFKSFQSNHSSARRRFTDFVFLYKTLSKEYPQCAVPPLPDKHNMSYVRGDRFGPDFTSRRAHSLNRFLKRLTLHPVLRRATILTLFCESSDWNATMKSRPSRAMSGSESGSTSVLETWTDSFLNAFTKPHKTDKRFADVDQRASKLGDDLGTVSKTVARVAKRESDLEGDYADLSTQFQKLAAQEPGIQNDLTKFATSVQSTSEGWKALKEHTDQNYLGSLKDMEYYIQSEKSLLKTREQKQLDWEGLNDYLSRAQNDHMNLSSQHGGSVGASGFLRQKIEDVRGVDHEQSKRERKRKLETSIERLTTEADGARKMSEAFDEEVVKEVADFERIKAVEFRDTMGGLADANIDFFRNNISIWEDFAADMEKGLAEVAERAAE